MASTSSSANTGSGDATKTTPTKHQDDWGFTMEPLIPSLNALKEIERNDPERVDIEEQLGRIFKEMVERAFDQFFEETRCLYCDFKAEDNVWNDFHTPESVEDRCFSVKDEMLKSRGADMNQEKIDGFRLKMQKLTKAYKDQMPEEFCKAMAVNGKQGH